MGPWLLSGDYFERNTVHESTKIHSSKAIPMCIMMMFIVINQSFFDYEEKFSLLIVYPTSQITIFTVNWMFWYIRNVAAMHAVKSLFRLVLKRKQTMYCECKSCYDTCLIHMKSDILHLQHTWIWVEKWESVVLSVSLMEGHSVQFIGICVVRTRTLIPSSIWAIYILKSKTLTGRLFSERKISRYFNTCLYQFLD